MNGQSPLIPGFVRAPPNAANTQFATITVKNCGIPGVVRAASNQRQGKNASREKTANGKVEVPQNDELTKQAVDEILRETRTSQIKADQVNRATTGWKRCPVQKTNKRFLNRTIISAVNHNNRERRKVKQRSKEKLTEHIRKENDGVSNRTDQNPPIATIVID